MINVSGTLAATFLLVVFESDLTAMKRWMALFSIFGVAAFVLILFHYWRNEAERRYAKIHGFMTLAEVEAVMGRNADFERRASPDLKTWEFRRWRSDHLEVEVQFNFNGHVVEKSLVRLLSDVPYRETLKRETFGPGADDMTAGFDHGIPRWDSRSPESLRPTR